MRVHLPTGGAMPGRRDAKNLGEALLREPQQALGPGRVAPHHEVLPQNVIPGMHADLETRVTHSAQDRCAAPADVGPRQQHAVQQRAQAIVFEHRGAADLGKKSGPEHAPQGAAGVVGTEAEVEAGRHLQALAQGHQRRHTELRAHQRVDVDLQGDSQRALSRDESASC